MFCLTFLLQIFSQLCSCLQTIIKIVRLLLAAVSINGLSLIHSCLRVPLGIVVWIYDTFGNDNLGIENYHSKIQITFLLVF